MSRFNGIAPTYNTQSVPKENLLTPAEACELLGLNKLKNPARKLWMLTCKGLPYVNLGLRTRFYKRTDIERFIAENQSR